MLTRLSRALVRVFPAILLIVVSVLAALFRSRRGTRKGATLPVPKTLGTPVRLVHRRGSAIALVGLLLGIGLILDVFDGEGALRRLVSPLPASDRDSSKPAAALPRSDVDAGQAKTFDAIFPGAKVSPGANGGLGGRSGTPDIVRRQHLWDRLRVFTNGGWLVHRSP